MGVKLTVDNRHVTISGANLKTIRAIDQLCAYLVAGHIFVPSFRSKRWDGKEHLFKFSKNRGYFAPVGFAEDLARELKRRKIPYKVEFKTKLRGKKKRFEWTASLRDYQKDAVKAILGKPIPGHGVLKLPIRSGKTRIVARCIWEIGRPAIFIVPSIWILHQSIDTFRQCMPDAPIGQIGDGVFDPQRITVSTIQTLAGMMPVRADKKKKREGRAAHPEFGRLMKMFDVCIADEVHHFGGQGEWHRILVDMDARFKIGVSATVFFDSKREQEKGVIWLRAAFGPIRYEISATRLIKDGFLLPQTVKMYRVTRPTGFENLKWSATLKKECVTENAYRNKMIADIVSSHVNIDNPKKTIVIANEHAHIKGICDALDDVSVEFRILTGKTSTNKRQEYVEEFIEGQCHVLIGNVMGEGVDLPDVEIVVNAEGGRDEKKTWQRQRNLTVVEGSNKTPLMIDFFDETSSILKKHSRARKKVYSSEEAFKVNVLDWKQTELFE